MTIKPSQASVTGNADGAKYAGSYRFILLMSNMVWIFPAYFVSSAFFFAGFRGCLIFLYLYILL